MNTANDSSGKTVVLDRSESGAPPGSAQASAGAGNDPGLGLLLRDILRDLPDSLGVAAMELHYATSRDGGILKLASFWKEAARAVNPQVSPAQLAEVRRSGEPSVLRDSSAAPPVLSWITIPVSEEGHPTPLLLLLGSAREPGSFARAEIDPLELLALKVFTYCFKARRLSLLTLPEYESLQVIDALPDPVLITNRSGEVVAVNSNFRFCFGRHAPLLPGCPLEVVLPATHAAIFRDALLRVTTRRPYQEIELPRLAGELAEMRFLLSANVLARNASSQPLIVFVLREVSSALELTQIRERENAQEFLLNTLMHDIRSPVAAIVQGVELLERLRAVDAPRGDRAAEDDVRSVLEVLATSAGQIQDLLGDVTDFVEARRLKKAQVATLSSLADIARQLVEQFALTSGAQHVQVEVVEDSQVLANRTQLCRALENLLSNAVKYSAPGSRVTLRVRRATDPALAALEVVDAGIGIPAEYFEKIWEPFYRVPAAKRRAEGRGLGLSIVRSIAEAHGGRVELESTEGRGSVFRMLLPRV